MLLIINYLNSVHKSNTIDKLIPLDTSCYSLFVATEMGRAHNIRYTVQFLGSIWYSKSQRCILLLFL